MFKSLEIALSCAVETISLRFVKKGQFKLRSMF